MSLGPTLETERLILRPPMEADFPAWAEFAADPEAARFVGGVAAPAAAWRGMACVVGAWSLRGFSMFSVLEKDAGRWVGRLGPWAPEGWPGTEVGYGIARDCWGRGYAVEGCVAAIDWAIDHLGWTDIIHCIDPENTKSQAIARKLGAVNRGPGRMPAPFEEHPVDIWGQTAEAWRSRRRRR
jgi:RimJ/RimL family protein N-acetyltransferase